jgi:hypothetical protein
LRVQSREPQNAHRARLLQCHSQSCLCSCFASSVLPCFRASVLPCFRASVLPCFCVSLLAAPLLPCFPASLLPCFPASLLPCFVPPCLRASLLLASSAPSASLRWYRRFQSIFNFPFSIFRLSQFQQFPQPLRLRARHRNLAGPFVIHFQNVARLEPRHHFLDVVDVHQI